MNEPKLRQFSRLYLPAKNRLEIAKTVACAEAQNIISECPSCVIHLSLATVLRELSDQPRRRIYNHFNIYKKLQKPHFLNRIIPDGRLSLELHRRLNHREYLVAASSIVTILTKLSSQRSMSAAVLTAAQHIRKTSVSTFYSDNDNRTVVAEVIDENNFFDQVLRAMTKNAAHIRIVLNVRRHYHAIQQRADRV
jgi:hypothetical protein